MKITLNLATKPYADQGPALKRLRIGMGVLAVLMALFGLGLMHFHQRAEQMRAQEAELDRQIAQVRQEEQGYRAQMQQPASARVLTQSVFLNGLFDEKSFSWTAAMEELERVLPGGVQVTALEPVRSKTGQLTLRLRVSGRRERAVELVRKMERSPRFVTPRISGENSEAASGAGDVQQVRDSGKVTFEILAEYNPATLEQRKAEMAAQKRKAGTEAGAAMGSPAGGHAARQPRQQPIRPGYIAPNAMPNGVPAMPQRRSAPPVGMQPQGGPQ